MDYQVWIKEEFSENYTKVDCGDLPAAKREIDKAVRTGGEPILTVEVPYELSIKTGEVGSEVKKSATKPSKDTRPESESQVRPGDATAVQELDK
uniref:Uncharacterized protein n=1 Tax=viral metagenome TaxID=1070528 RepID=A0A6M3M233_9ZZZZ